MGKEKIEKKSVKGRVENIASDGSSRTFTGGQGPRTLRESTGTQSATAEFQLELEL